MDGEGWFKARMLGGSNKTRYGHHHRQTRVNIWIWNIKFSLPAVNTDEMVRNLITTCNLEDVM